ncbi:zinc-ribbon domain-containing protein [Stenotrophomonas maltophilia]|uniref:zinc-ribbon domain-containing protein n=1 Tax=Stenotrophomonas maltophilia TaxID=40324 RepID=UPI0039C276A6
MALISCVECGKQISDKASSCPSCGAPAALPGSAPHAATQPIKAVTFTPMSIAALVVAAIVLFFLAMVVIRPGAPGAPKDPVKAAEQAAERRTVQYCEDRYKEMNADRQYTVEVLQFHSQACRKARDDYRAKWGRDP